MTKCCCSAPCNSSKDCKAGICDSVNGTCVDRVQASDCDSGQFCIAGANWCASARCQGGGCGGDSWLARLPEGSAPCSATAAGCRLPKPYLSKVISAIQPDRV